MDETRTGQECGADAAADRSLPFPDHHRESCVCQYCGGGQTVRARPHDHDVVPVCQIDYPVLVGRSGRDNTDRPTISI